MRVASFALLRESVGFFFFFAMADLRGAPPVGTFHFCQAIFTPHTSIFVAERIEPVGGWSCVLILTRLPDPLVCCK
jgi:hypothetical protein